MRCPFAVHRLAYGRGGINGCELGGYNKKRRRMMKQTIIKRIWMASVVVLATAATVKSAHANCYTFQNNATGPVTLHFTYNAPVAPGSNNPINVTIPSRQVYQTCYNGRDGFTATISVTGSGTPSWRGLLVLGDGPPPNFAPGGTYTINPTPVAVNPPPAFGNSSYPGHEKFMVTHQDFFDLPMGGPGWRRAMMHVSILCRNGQKWNLVCDRSGSACNVNEHEFEHGVTRWNVGQHCDGARGNAN
jgi:hypothetical protein